MKLLWRMNVRKVWKSIGRREHQNGWNILMHSLILADEEEEDDDVTGDADNDGTGIHR